MTTLNRYARIIERIFLDHYEEGLHKVEFEREEIVSVATTLQIALPKNLGDVLYSFRYRTELPESIREKAPADHEWIIRPIGRARYQLIAVLKRELKPSSMLAETKIPDATPGIITMYALGDEQAVLAKLRYNRLIDIFTGVTCYSLQNHLRTTVPSMGQVETDELYVGVDRRGAHYVFPVQAKGGRDKLSIVQIEQDVAPCASKFPNAICRAIGAQFMANNLIALFEFEEAGDGVVVAAERHFRLVSPENLTADDLKTYRERASNG